MKTIKKLLQGVIFATFASQAILASAATYHFSQSGYADGATITGSFTGVDLDHDGQINSFAGEVSAFTLTFSGNSIVPTFTHSFSDLSGLVYTVGHSTLGSDSSGGTEGMASNWEHSTGYDFASGLGPTGLNGGRIIDTASGATTSTDALIQITSVPEPASALMTLAGLGVLGVLARRRRQG